VTVVARPREPFGGDCALLRSDTGLESVEEREANRLLELVVAVELDVGALPVVVEELALTLYQSVPTCVACCSERSTDLVAHGGARPLARPAIREELDDPQPLFLREIRRNRDPTDVLTALRHRRRTLGPLDEVVYRRRHSEPTPPGRVDEGDPCIAGQELFRLERRFEHGCCSRVGLGQAARLVGDELRLDDDAQWGIEWLDLVENRGGRTLDERDESRRADPDPGSRRRDPVDLAT